ncbi:MAG: hypothetical protein ACR2NZ_06970 [Rubripirellula sp.]
MMLLPLRSALGLGLIVVTSALLPVSLHGQIRGGASSRGGLGGARGSIGGGNRGLSSPRSGAGARNNPIANPAPSLTPSEVLNPAGSLNSGQVLNPEPSLNRPRTGGAKSANTSRSPSLSRTQGNLSSPQLSTASPIAARELPSIPAGANVRTATLALQAKIAAVMPKSRSPLDSDLKQLLEIDPASDAPTKKEKTRLATTETSLRAFEIGTTNAQTAEIVDSPEFRSTRASLEYYLTSPLERRRDELNVAFATLRSSLASFENGDAWANYLMPAEFADANQTIDPTGPRTRALLKRYESIRNDAALSDVAGLRGFGNAESALQRYVQLGESLPVNDPTSSTPTED